MITFNDFVHRYKFKKATSNMKTQRVLDSIRLNNVGIYLRDGSFSSDIGINNLNPSKGTDWVCYINEKYFDSYGVVCSKKLAKYVIKQNEYCLYSEYQVQKRIVFVQDIVYIYFI